MEQPKSQDIHKPSPLEKKKDRMPHIYVLLFIISGLAALLTYIIPAVHLNVFQDQMDVNPLIRIHL